MLTTRRSGSTAGQGEQLRIGQNATMRLWSLHPSYLDRQGLTAGWREALLAQAVLAGRTKGYRSHPQLARFRAATDPLASIGGFLVGIADEADRRGYRYDRARIITPTDPPAVAIEVTDGQLGYEWEHLLAKLRQRSPQVAEEHAGVTVPRPHPCFRQVRGPVAEWERR